MHWQHSYWIGKMSFFESIMLYQNSSYLSLGQSIRIILNEVSLNDIETSSVRIETFWHSTLHSSIKFYFKENSFSYFMLPDLAVASVTWNVKWCKCHIQITLYTHTIPMCSMLYHFTNGIIMVEKRWNVSYDYVRTIF